MRRALFLLLLLNQACNSSRLAPAAVLVRGDGALRAALVAARTAGDAPSQGDVRGWSCVIRPHFGVAARVPVYCDGELVPNWFVDLNPEARRSREHCLRRAETWLHACGVDRPSYAGPQVFDEWRRGEPLRGASGDELGAVVAPGTGWLYFVPR